MSPGTDCVGVSETVSVGAASEAAGVLVSVGVPTTPCGDAVGIMLVGVAVGKKKKGPFGKTNHGRGVGVDAPAVGAGDASLSGVRVRVGVTVGVIVPAAPPVAVTVGLKIGVTVKVAVAVGVIVGVKVEAGNPS